MRTEYDDYKISNFTTEYAAGIVVVACLVFLILVRRGFRGIRIGIN